jgi:Peptidase family M28/PA domain
VKKALAVLLLCSSVAWAQKASDPITAEDIKAHMFFLAADEMAGRDATSPEGRIAANYIASEFMSMGLKPVGDGGTYFQNFDMIVGAMDPAETSLKVKIGNSEKSYSLGHDFNWMRQSARPTQVSAPLVFAGYGINAPEYRYNDFAGVDVRGKVAIVLNREPQANDPNSKFKGKWDTIHSYFWEKIEAVRKAGAVGLLIINDRVPRRKPRIASAIPNYLAGPAPEYALADSLWDIPVFTVTPDLANEILSSSGKTVEAAQSAIDTNGTPASFDVPNVTVWMSKGFKNSEVKKARNVVGLLEGTDPKLKQETVVVSGHYDHVGIVSGRIYRGADDNASGAIGTMEIAKALVANRPKRSVLFICFDAEERGLLGAFYYVEHPIVPLDDTVADLNMDMIGRDEVSANWPTPADGNRNMVNIVGTLYDPQLKQMIEAANRNIGLRLDYKTDVIDPESWFARSDHFCFAVHGIPMVLFNTGEQADYHTENDTWDRINYPKMEKIVRLIYLTSVDVANSPQRPKFTP